MVPIFIGAYIHEVLVRMKMGAYIYGVPILSRFYSTCTSLSLALLYCSPQFKNTSCMCFLDTFPENFIDLEPAFLPVQRLLYNQLFMWARIFCVLLQNAASLTLCLIGTLLHSSCPSDIGHA